MIVAVSGASGHVGINLIPALIGRGYTVRVLSHRNVSSFTPLSVSRIKGDLVTGDGLGELVTGADIVIHLAAKISISGDPDGMVRKVNSDGTKNILAASRAAGVRKFIHFSSIHAFQQRPSEKVLDERRPLVQDRGFAYDLSKAEAERAVMKAATEGFPSLVLSPTAIIGPHDPEPSLIGQAVVGICKGTIPALVPGGYNWVDVRDVVAGTLAAIDRGRPGEKYLLSGHWHSLLELSILIGQILGKKTTRMVVPLSMARLGLPFISLFSRFTGNPPLYTRESLTVISESHRNISHAKATEELGYDPRPLEVTLRDFIPWLTAQGFI